MSSVYVVREFLLKSNSEQTIGFVSLEEKKMLNTSATNLKKHQSLKNKPSKNWSKTLDQKNYFIFHFAIIQGFLIQLAIQEMLIAQEFSHKNVHMSFH